MPSLLGGITWPRSPASAAAPLHTTSLRTREFVYAFELKNEGEEMKVLHNLGLRGMVRAVCGIGESRPNAALSITGSDRIVEFVCDQMLLDFRRVATETKVNPYVWFEAGTGVLLRVDTPMMVWLFGVLSLGER